MNTQQLIQEYECLDAEQRHNFLASITKLETIASAQFTAAEVALKELERGEFTTYKNATSLINDIK